MRNRAALGAFTGAAQIVLNAGLLLLVVRMIIATLGMEAYGVYALVTAVGALGIFAGFGFNTSLIKYLAEQQDRRAGTYDILAALVIIGGASLVVAAAALVFDEFVLVHVLNISRGLITPGVRFFYGACVGANLLLLLGQVPAAVLDAQQKVYMTNGIQLGTGVLGKGLMILSLAVAPALSWLGWIMLASAAAALILLTLFAVRTWGSFSAPRWPRMIWPTARKHFAYGRAVYATSIVGFFYESVTKVFISHWAGLTEVGYFDLALRIRNPIWAVLERVAYPAMPKIAGTRERDDIRRTVEEAEQKLAMIAVPAGVAAAFMSGPAVALWLGDGLTPVVVSIIFVVSTNLISVLFVPLYQFLMVKGYPGRALLLQSVNLFVTVAGIAVLVPLFGYYGAMAAYCIAVLGSAGGCMWYQYTLLGSPPFLPGPLRWKLVRVGLALAAANVAVVVAQFRPPVQLALMLGANGAGTVMLFRRFGVITEADVERYLGRDSRAGTLLGKLLFGRERS